MKLAKRLPYTVLAGCLSVLFLQATPVAQAVPTAADPGCSKTQSLNGECLVSYSSPGELPEAAAVRGAKQSGNIAAATKFVDRYANQRPSGVQTLLSNILKEPAKQPNGGSDGNVINRKEWNLNTIERLSVCFSSCTIIDVARIAYRVSGYQDGILIISGEIQTDQGAKFIITNHSCEVYTNVPFSPDPQVGFFRSCGTTNGREATIYNILESTSNTYIPRTLSYIRINLVLMPGQNNSDAVLKIPSNLNYESQDFRSDGQRSIDWMPS